MNLKFTVRTITTAIAAGASAFGAAFAAANLDNKITQGEWLTITWAVVTAVLAALAHDDTPTPVK